jgi:hypothetical protein
MGPRERQRTLDNIGRLAHAEQQGVSPDVAAVREDLEAQLEGTVPRSVAARRLGVSHTALNHWIAAGDVPVVITRKGRKEVPIPALLPLLEQVAAAGRPGNRRSHALERAMIEQRRRAEHLHPQPETGGRSRSDPHRVAELRSLVYHRALAPRLRRPAIEQARGRLRRWQDEGRIDPRYASAWEEVLALPIEEIRQAIGADDEQGRGLRQSTPFAGLLSEPERRKILATVSAG